MDGPEVHPYNILFQIQWTDGWDNHPYNFFQIKSTDGLEIHPYNFFQIKLTGGTEVHPYNFFQIKSTDGWDNHPYNIFIIPYINERTARRSIPTIIFISIYLNERIGNPLIRCLFKFFKQKRWYKPPSFIILFIYLM